MGNSLFCNWRYTEVSLSHRCSLCQENAPNNVSNYVFLAVGRGKHDGNYICEACLRARLDRKRVYETV